MTRARKIEEAARAYRRAVDEYMECHSGVNAGKIVTADKVLDAALAAPEDDGDVVERAADIIDTLVNNTSHIEWVKARQIACARSSAGLLARPVDRERLAARLAVWRYTNGCPQDRVYLPARCDYEEADAILREVGR